MSSSEDSEDDNPLPFFSLLLDKSKSSKSSNMELANGLMYCVDVDVDFAVVVDFDVNVFGVCLDKNCVVEVLNADGVKASVVARRRLIVIMVDAVAPPNSVVQLIMLPL
jgi:hypothetical protein